SSSSGPAYSRRGLVSVSWPPFSLRVHCVRIWTASQMRLVPPAGEAALEAAPSVTRSRSGASSQRSVPIAGASARSRAQPGARAARPKTSAAASGGLARADADDAAVIAHERPARGPAGHCDHPEAVVLHDQLEAVVA